MDSIIKIDTIALNKQFETIKDLKDLIIDFNVFKKIESNEIVNYNNSKVNKKSISYILTEEFKHNIYGLENLKIKQNFYYDIESKAIVFFTIPNMHICFNAKLLKENYLHGLNKNNIDIAIDYLIKLLETKIKISKRILLNNFKVGYVDFTENIKINNQYKINDYLKAIEYNTNINRTLKKINTRYTDAGTLYFDLSYKNTFKFYDKNKELSDAIKVKKNSQNKKFYSEYKELIAKSKDILRFEIRIYNKRDRLKKLLNIDKLNLITLLNSNINICYDYLIKLSNKKSDIHDEVDFNKMRLKDFKNYITGAGIFYLFNNSFDKLHDLLFEKIANIKARATKYNNFNNFQNCYNYFNKINNLNNINYNDLFNNTLELLKIA